MVEGFGESRVVAMQSGPHPPENNTKYRRLSPLDGFGALSR
jgi:hypothetical protein